ncbi:MAG TPA: methyl-accepting chemotaxis protein [Burkholderiales bacterium]|nr:methyl-accepting chemotaxis protein [Burkholderiales bacterium]
MAFRLPSFNPKNDPRHGRKTASTENTTLIMSGLKKMSESSSNETPLIGHLPVEKQYLLTMVLGLGFLVVSGVLLMYNGVQTSNKTEYITKVTEMQMLSQRLTKSAQQAVAGDPKAYTQLQSSEAKFTTDLNALTKGSFALPASPQSIQPLLAQLKAHWTPLENEINLIVQQKNSLSDAYSGTAQINQNADAILALARALQTRSNNNSRNAAAIENFVQLAQHMAHNATALMLLVNQPVWRFNSTHNHSGSNSVTAANNQEQVVTDQLKQDSIAFQTALLDLQNGPDALTDAGARNQLAQIANAFQPIHANLGPILKNVEQLITTKNTSYAAFKTSDDILNDARLAAKAYENLGSIGNAAAIVSGLLALGSLILFGFVNINESKRRVQLSEAENKRNQEAILRLLNELGDLADGDLTANATVTEDITGAIADSINFTIDELRGLVSGINRATEKVTNTTLQAQAISEELLAAAQRQSQEIEETSAAILGISQSINEVSASANQSAQVANQSLEAAEKGTQAVENSIAGMNSIRENIQETSKRIKRLGESSQEIGEIVELISDITEQTNVLALNAAIQAAAAGEAGRGFSVVAEEVQRLAERSGQATKQIAAIVKTIQSDTQDAVSAMETSTQGVVEGAKLSDAAGRALNEIGEVSRSLANLIENISAATDNQAVATSKVAQAMQYIQQITEQTTAGTQQTASSIGELSTLAADLKKSISGFKLA